VIVEELRRLLTWEERHRRLLSRLLLVLMLTAVVDVIGTVVVCYLEVWAVLVVAGSAGAIASFFQTGDSE
jgi:hypothetical protein